MRAKNQVNFIPVALALALLLAGCRNAPPLSHPTDGTDDAITFYLGPVPIDRPMENRAWHIGHTIAEDSPITNERISVSVGGDVNHPGHLDVLKGTTILGAIKQAGGFTSMSFPKIHLFRGGKPMPYLYSLQRERIRGMPNHYRIWFASVRRNGWRDEVDKRTRSDVVLESGDIIFVPRVQ